jgi:digeranylgeranylglycerophospholipid reductase
MVESIAEKFDVVIIGAGPAGGACAERAAQLGLNILVLEEDKKIGEPVHCGECISKVALDKIGKVPDEVIATHVTGVRVIFPGPRSNLVDESGVVLHKEKFEKWLIEKAKKNGAKISLGESFEQAEHKKGIWEIKTSKRKINSKIIIDASGVKSVLSQKLGVNQKFSSVIGIQYLMEGMDSDDYLDFYLWPKYAPHGYLWVIPKGNGLANVGLVTTDSNKARHLLNEFLKERGWLNNKIIHTFGGLIPASGPLPNTCGNGWMLIGDAAGFTSPLFEGGTHLGIQSGLFAAQTAKKAIDQNDFSKKILTEYETLWKKEFPDYKGLVGGKDAIYSLTDDELKDVSELMPNQLGRLSNLDKAKVLFNILFVKSYLSKNKLFKVFRAFQYSRAKKYGW